MVVLIVIREIWG